LAVRETKPCSQTTLNRRRPLRILQPSLRDAVFAATARLQCQPAVGPQLSLRAETMRRLYQSNDQSHPNRPQSRYLSEKLMSWMLLAFGQQLPPGLSTQVQQNIQLLLEPLSATTQPRLGQLFQPSVTVADRI